MIKRMLKRIFHRRASIDDINLSHIAQGIAQANEGKTIPWEQVKKELFDE